MAIVGVLVACTSQLTPRPLVSRPQTARCVPTTTCSGPTGNCVLVGPGGVSSEQVVRECDPWLHTCFDAVDLGNALNTEAPVPGVYLMCVDRTVRTPDYECFEGKDGRCHARPSPFTDAL